MSDQVAFTLRGRNPDLLTCIANVSNDEVFTPLKFANRMLDTFAAAWATDHSGANLRADKSVKIGSKLAAFTQLLEDIEPDFGPDQSPTEPAQFE